MADIASSGPREISIRDILLPIWAERKRILIVSVAVGLVTLGVNFLLPKSFKSSAVILPETDKSK
ncbi:MAG TPA: Wzz/FepE/Etk N-terminal domain-containing protein, partial [Bacteroidota bacterium]|nr:Wzz/FepE/Etk N-terminal domain-containing protein [Bacteroidota bacterium]